MKKLILLSVILIGTVCFSFSQNAPTATPTEIKAVPAEPKADFKWIEMAHDFGKIEQGKPVTVEFKFTNTGKAPLIMNNVHGSCGCTTTDYTKEPVAPGKSGFIKATYNAANMGSFTKTVTVNANTEKGTEVLTIKGEVIASPNSPAINTPN